MSNLSQYYSKLTHIKNEINMSRRHMISNGKKGDDFFFQHWKVTESLFFFLVSEIFLFLSEKIVFLLVCVENTYSNPPKDVDFFVSKTLSRVLPSPDEFPYREFWKKQKKKKNVSTQNFIYGSTIKGLYVKKFSGSLNPESRPPVTRRVHVLGWWDFIVESPQSTGNSPPQQHVRFAR